MKNTFNLNAFQKTAFYQDGKGLVQKQTRSFMNCYKAKMDKGASANDAWNSCLEEYQNADSSGWNTKYAAKKEK